MTEKKHERAEALLSSLRGQYIIGQALDVAIKAMSKVKEPMRETSNIADMKLLRDELFPMAYAARLAQEKWNKLQETDKAK